MRVPTADTKPELEFKRKVVEVVFKKLGFNPHKYVTNQQFVTKFRYWGLYPDGRSIIPEIPLIWEVDGVRWHSSIKRQKKDAANNECYVGEGYYVYRVTDKAVLKDTENVICDFEEYIKEILNERGRNPRIRKFPTDD